MEIRRQKQGIEMISSMVITQNAMNIIVCRRRKLTSEEGKKEII